MRAFCVAESPFELDEWIAATGVQPDHVMVFESWSKRRTLADTLAKARTFGHDEILVTWEPWAPTPVGTAPGDQGRVQPEYAYDKILDGAWDDYIDNMARCFRDSGMRTIYLRFAHEMNGTWYPWSEDAAGYVEMWKYIRHRMRSVRAAWNTRFVWAPNLDIWRTSHADWLTKVLPYWPGHQAVDYIGYTMINFGGDKTYTIPQFIERFDLSRRVFGKPTLAAEVNVALEQAPSWLSDLATAIGAGRLLLSCVSLSQGPSRAQAAGQIPTGNLSWNLADYPQLVPVVSQVIDALHAT